ncbi:MAG TPA: lysoplasmalogenase [Chitinophagales bacterium]|nr:lysoplasmalogenase [Chitinophagales bacterium]HRG84678.1 lysoplasmalogenase [Chitinophagales bacterium]
MKLNKNTVLLLTFLVVAAIHLLGILVKQPLLADVTKVLLMPLLLAHVITLPNRKFIGFNLLVIAILFCWAGDVLLMFTEINELFFLLGLAAFLIGHIFYMLTFNKMADKNSIGKPLQPLFYLIPLLFALSLLIVLFPNLGEMKVPVIAYATVISLMCVAAMRRWQRTDMPSFITVLTGAVLFIFSDALIAINKFHTPFNAASLLIMITYIAAQYLIITGLLKHVHPVKN